MRTTLAILSLLLAMTVGVIAGIGADQYFRLRSWRDLIQQRQRAARVDTRTRDPRQWAQDSARMASFERMARERWRPREIARHQAMMHCAVSFEFRDSLTRHMQLMTVRASDRLAPEMTRAEGWAFDPRGFQRGDTVTVVLPNVWCGDLLITGWGTSLTIPPPPLGLDVR
jgi:hypothetical protein